MSDQRQAATKPSGTAPLLSVRDLTVEFETDSGQLRATDGVSFDIDRGETVCIVGESGSGKTVTAESITRLIPTPPGRIVDGSVTFDGRDLVTLSKRQLRAIRGNHIAHVFQNPQDALALVLDGEVDRAHELLVETFPTVCARTEPRTVSVADGHRTACHLVDSEDRQQFREDSATPED